MKEVLARLEHFVRHSVEARPQVEAEVLATTRTDHVDVPETDPVDHTQPVVFGLGEHRVDSHPQPLGEVLEPGVGRGLQDDRVPCQEDAPGFVLVPVVPALPFRQLDRGAAAGGEGDLMDLSGPLDREASLWPNRRIEAHTQSCRTASHGPSWNYLIRSFVQVSRIAEKWDPARAST